MISRHKTTILALALCLLSACGSDSSDDGAGGSSGTGGSTGGSSGTAGASGGAGSGAAGAGGSGAACTQPSDCRTYSNYCDGCQCLALGANEGDPSCNGTPVSCLVDPCLDRTVTCLGGTCALTERR